MQANCSMKSILQKPEKFIGPQTNGITTYY